MRYTILFLEWKFHVKILTATEVIHKHVLKVAFNEVSYVLNFPEFYIYSGNNFKINLDSNTTLKNKIYFKCIWPETWILFFRLWTLFISCKFLERAWEIMRYPRYCLAELATNFLANINIDFYFSAPPTLAYQPPYAHWHIKYVNHTATLTTVIVFWRDID